MGAEFLGIVKALLLPPGGVILAIIAAAIVLRKSKTAIIVVFFMITTVLYFVSTPFVASKLATLIETREIFDPAKAQDAQAIIVLSCGTYLDAPEYQGADSASACTLARIAYATTVYTATGLPVMTCGGPAHEDAEPEAEVMARELRNLFGVETTWTENLSRNTYNNAKNAAAILKPANINQVILVTHAMHMKRARYSFERNGITVIPAPARFYTIPINPPTYWYFLPSIGPLYVSYATLHESIGYIWYKARWNRRVAELEARFFGDGG